MGGNKAFIQKQAEIIDNRIKEYRGMQKNIIMGSEKPIEHFKVSVVLPHVIRAREKVKEGTYGICDVCKKPIPPERLKVLPAATKCVYCKEREEAECLLMKN